MQYSCREIQNAMISGDPRIEESAALSHLEICSVCQGALELPGEISMGIRNINPLPAPLEIHDNVMTRLRLEKSKRGALRCLKLARIATAAIAYTGLALIIVLFWNTFISSTRGLIDGFSAFIETILSAAPSRLDALAGLIESLARSSILPAVALIGTTLLWAFALIKIRETLKN